MNLDTEHKGWMILSRAMLHARQADDYQVMNILDHCRRLILAEEYPLDEYIASLLIESFARLASESVPIGKATAASESRVM